MIYCRPLLDIFVIYNKKVCQKSVINILWQKPKVTPVKMFNEYLHCVIMVFPDHSHFLFAIGKQYQESIEKVPLIRCLKTYLSRDMRFPAMWFVRPAKPQNSLRISAV